MKMVAAMIFFGINAVMKVGLIVDFQGRVGITSILRQNLRPVMLSVDQKAL